MQKITFDITTHADPLKKKTVGLEKSTFWKVNEYIKPLNKTNKYSFIYSANVCQLPPLCTSNF